MPSASFSILAPDLDLSARRMLKVVLQKAGFTTSTLDFASTLADCPTRHVLSIGKAGLDTWHEFGLIQIGTHHGCVFKPWDPTIGHRVVMVLHHPSTLLQLTIGGYEAKDQMAFDLVRWRGVVQESVDTRDLVQRMCGACGGRRGKGGAVSRRAEHWVDELDGCGLCDDHFRGRAKFTKKSRGKKAKPGTPAAQITGQAEMFADGERVMVSKK